MEYALARQGLRLEPHERRAHLARLRVTAHRSETFKLSKDPLFVEKVRDIVGLYMNPPDHALVLCVDEKSQIQALDRTQPCFPCGLDSRTADARLQAAWHDVALCRARVKTGKVIGECHRRHRAQELRNFLGRPIGKCPRRSLSTWSWTISTHKTPSIRRWLAKRPRYHLHFTPTSASWLNLVERWFADLTHKQVRRGAHRSVREHRRQKRGPSALRLDEDRRPDP